MTESGAPRQRDASAPDAPPSRAQLKREADALQDLGESLAAMPPARLAGVELPEPLRDAIDELRRTRSHEGRRRQLQLVGKRMRDVDDPQPLRDAVAAWRLGPAVDALALHEAEAWRARLVGGDDALGAFVAAHPRADAAALRRLVHAARAESRDAAADPNAPKPAPGAAVRQGRAWRALFRHIRPIVAPPAAGVAAPGGDGDGDGDTDTDTGNGHADAITSRARGDRP